MRKRAGLFDLSHMGQFVLTGEDVGDWADTLTINAVGTMKPLQARYNIFCNEEGGAHDDTIFYRLDGRWLLVVNASNADKMWAHLNANTGSAAGVELENQHGERALIAIQGPKSVTMLQPHVDIDLAGMKYYFCAEGNVYGVPATIARTGYTGEDGFELFVDGERAPEIWNALLRDHAADGLEPCGLGARDVLRLEAGMPLYGHELTETITPVQAGQSWALKMNKPDFIGKAALAQQLERDDFSGSPALRWPGARRRARDIRFISAENASARCAAARWRPRSATRTSRRRSFPRRPQLSVRFSVSISAVRCTRQRSLRCLSTNALPKPTWGTCTSGAAGKSAV